MTDKILKDREYQQCTKCVMDTTDTEIYFDNQGICNHCHQYVKHEAEKVLKGEDGQRKINEIIHEIKQGSKGRKYNCIIGISGGVDSTFLAYYVKNIMGLNPLAVHFDNGWNSEIAVQNIQNLVNTLNIDLYTYVIDWKSFKDIQLAYFKASVIDIEVPTDQFIFAALFEIARKKNINYVISGNNVVTETILPDSWYFKYKFDLKNLKDIHEKYGKTKIKSFPNIGKWQRYFNKKIHRLNFYTILNYIDYNYKDVKDLIINKLGWTDYGGKHYESIFTRFYQGYILPKKFNVDKRKAHLSNLICSGQITKEEALRILSKNSYTEDMQIQDKNYFIKKLGLTELEFDEIMSLPIKKHEEFKMEQSVYKDYPILKILKPIGDLFK